jgi:hypothetical protein
MTIGAMLRDPNFAWGVLGGSVFVGTLIYSATVVRERQRKN